MLKTLASVLAYGMKLEYSINPVCLKIDGKIIQRGNERFELSKAGLSDNRSILQNMPALKHDKDHTKSEVLDFVGWTCLNASKMPVETLSEAKRVFNVARSKNCRWIVYDANKCTWSGSLNANPFLTVHKILSDTNKRIDRLNKDLLSLKIKLGLK